MRYYTKEWYQLMQKLDYTTFAKMIPYKEQYSDSDIEELYEKELEEYCAENELELNDESRAEFKELYDECLELLEVSTLPKWVFEELDSRLIALELYPENIFDRLHAEEVKNRESFDAIMNDAEADEMAHMDLNDVRMILINHDATIFKIAEANDQIELTISDLFGSDDNVSEEEMAFSDDEYEYYEPTLKTLVFKGNARISSDDGNKIVDALKEDPSSEDTDITWLYEEVCRQDDKYLVDILVSDAANELHYIKIECEEIRASEG